MRGFSAVSLLLVDEASRVPDELYKAMRPMLAVSDGDLWLMSTPYGKRGFFWETWANGGRMRTWERSRAPATECTRISKGFLEEERRGRWGSGGSGRSICASSWRRTRRCFGKT